MVSGDSWCLRLVFSLQSSLLNENQFVNLFYQLVDVHCLQPKPMSQQVRYKQFQCSSHATEGNRFVLDAFSITFKKWTIPGLFFWIILGLSFTNIKQKVYSKLQWKMYIQYSVLGFEHTTLSEYESPPITTRPRPPITFVFHFFISSLYNRKTNIQRMNMIDGRDSNRLLGGYMPPPPSNCASLCPILALISF